MALLAARLGASIRGFGVVFNVLVLAPAPQNPSALPDNIIKVFASALIKINGT